MIRRLILLVTLMWALPLIAAPKYEIRAVWLSTIYGLDWPVTQVTSPAKIEQQKQQLCSILDELEKININTVFFQSRIRGDVVYRSAMEPWSKTLTGKAGNAPGYDPLAFAIEECHKRGMECHAWLVTFPLGTEKHVKELGSSSVVKKNPSICKRYNGEWFLDPGNPGTSDYLTRLVRELVQNYDVDGVHFDYIRYPEKAKGFPDSDTFKKYGKGKSLSNWRRENINNIVYRVYDNVKQIKPWVQVSSAPLGKYSRIPKVPNAGWTAYEDVYQDPKDWITKGKHDFIAPMMYYKEHLFFPFVDNWVEDSNGRFVIPGLGAYRMNKEEANWSVNIITDQIDYGRYYGTAGVAFFRCGNLLSNTKGILKELQSNYYKHPAMLPPLSWLNNEAPSAPSLVKAYKDGTDLCLEWDMLLDYKKKDLTFTVYRSKAEPVDINDAANIVITRAMGNKIWIPLDESREEGFFYVVTASNRYRTESEISPSVYYYASKYIK